MPLAGLVLNRVHTTGAQSLSAAPGHGRRGDPGRGRASHPLAAGVLRLHAERMRIIEREQSLRGRFTAAHPRVPVVDVPAQPGDVHDLAGLRDDRRRPGRRLSAEPPAPTTPDSGTGRSSPPGPPRSSPTVRGPVLTRLATTSPPEGSSVRQAALVLVPRRLEQGRHEVTFGPAAQQRPALTLGHAAPDPELDPVVERVGQALGAHRAAHADGLGAVLRGALHEQAVRVAGPAAPRDAQSSAHVIAGPSFVLWCRSADLASAADGTERDTSGDRTVRSKLT